MSSDTIFASKKLIASNPEAVRRFLAGWFDAVAFMRKDKAETVRVARKMTGFDETVQVREYDQSIAMFSSDGKFDKESLATLKQSFADLKLLDFDAGPGDGLYRGVPAEALGISPLAPARGAAASTTQVQR